MITICQECFSINISAQHCKKCGFPIGKKIYSESRDGLFFDCIELININQIESSELSIKKSLSIKNDKGLEMLLMKIEEIKSILLTADKLYDSANKAFAEKDYLKAAELIQEAYFISPLPKFQELFLSIKKEKDSKEEEESDTNDFYHALSLIDKNDFTAGIDIIKKLVCKYPTNEQYKNAYPIAIKKYVTHSLKLIEEGINKKEFDDINILISDLKMYVSDHTDVNSLFNLEQLFNKRKKEFTHKKKLIKSISIVGAFIIIGLGVIYFLNYNNDNEIWKTIQLNGTINNYKKFIQENGNNFFINEAKEELKILQTKDSIIWTSILSNPSKTNVTDYINTTAKTGGMHLIEANAKLDSLDWNEAIKANDIELIKNYLTTHPLGNHIEEANSLLSVGIDNNDKSKVEQFINNYFVQLSNKNIEAAILNYEEITPTYESNLGLDREQIKQIITTDIFSENNKYSIDRSSFSMSKNANGNIDVTFITSIYKTIIREEYNSETGQLSPNEYQNTITSKIKITLNRNWKIISYLTTQI